MSSDCSCVSQRKNALSGFEKLLCFRSTKMTTIPARLATLTRTSPSAAEARKRALSLYREWYRSVSFVFVFLKETREVSHGQFRLLKSLLCTH